MSRQLSEFKIRGLAPVSAEEVILVLEQKDGARLLPIHAGAHDATALAVEVSGVARARPLTHDLLLNVLSAVGWAVKRVVVTEIKSDVFYARIYIEKDGEERSVDARPSDALNVAVRAHCPIFVANKVLARSEPIFKPIDAKELERFRKELAAKDPAEALAKLEGKPAPREPGREETSS